MLTKKGVSAILYSVVSLSACVCLLFFGARASAGPHEPPAIGDGLREADLVVMAEPVDSDQYSGVVQLRVHRVLKGGLSGEKQIRVGRMFVNNGWVLWPLPSLGRAAFVLRRAHWSPEYEWYPTMVYQERDDIRAVQTLCALHTVKSERRRLLELYAMARRDVPHMRTELIAELKAMTDSATFSTALQIYDDMRADEHKSRSVNSDIWTWMVRYLFPDRQRPAKEDWDRRFSFSKYQEAISSLGDERVVPSLLQAYDDSSWGKRTEISQLLYAYYGDVPAVKKLLAMHHAQKPAVRLPFSFDFALQERMPECRFGGCFGGPELLQAFNLRLAENPAARDAYWRIVNDKPGEPDAIVAAIWLLEEATGAERERLRVLLLPHIRKRVSNVGQNDFKSIDAQFLRRLRHPACIESLLALLKYEGYDAVFITYEATLALSELGDTTRARAVDALINFMREDTPPLSFQYVQALTWLSTDEEWVRVTSVLLPKYGSEFLPSPTQSLLVGSKDEAPLLLANQGLWNHDEPAWTLRRLGELRDPRTVRPLVNYFVELSLWSPEQWRQRGLEAALIQIGGPAMETAMTDLLLRLRDEPQVLYIPVARRDVWGPFDPIELMQERATRILLAVQEREGLQTARDILSGRSPGSKIEALGHIGVYGTKADIALLAPYKDFWKADRKLQPHTVTADALLRARWREH
jgi:hypothetical protein